MLGIGSGHGVDAGTYIHMSIHFSKFDSKSSRLGPWRPSA